MEDNNLSNKTITLKDIAKMCNVSQNTVCRALRGEKYIKKELLENIQKCADKYGYVPNKMAINLKKTPKKKYIAIYNNTIYPFFNSIFYYINNIMEHEKIHFEIDIRYRQRELTTDMVSDLITNGVMGVITPYYVTREINELFLKHKVPLLVIGQDCTQNNVDSVVLNDFNAAYQATKHLIEKGHKKIASVFMEKGTSFMNNRFLGYQQALKDYGIPFENKYCVWNFTYEYNLDGLMSDGVTGFFCFNDYIAYSIYKKLNLMENKQYEVTGIDNIAKDLNLPNLFYSFDFDKKLIAQISKDRILKKSNREIPLEEVKRYIINDNEIIQQ